MKRLLIMALGMAVLLLAGCSSEKPTPEPTVEPKMLGLEFITIYPFEDQGGFTIDNPNQSGALEELPGGYGYIGDLSKDGWGVNGNNEMRDAGLKGCKVYANLSLDPSERKDVYLYQPVGEDGEEWAYVKYVKILYGAVEEQV